MGTIIIISCILGSGKDWHPRGHYRDWDQCQSYARRFEKRLTRAKPTLCWCHRKSYKYQYQYTVVPPIPDRNLGVE